MNHGAIRDNLSEALSSERDLLFQFDNGTAFKIEVGVHDFLANHTEVKLSITKESGESMGGVVFTHPINLPDEMGKWAYLSWAERQLKDGLQDVLRKKKESEEVK